jgi:hypothetical protein
MLAVLAAAAAVVPVRAQAPPTPAPASPVWEYTQKFSSNATWAGPTIGYQCTL